ncbi:hypothetical protein ACFSM5_15665 [Lacibacterium aquatile]|uniref:Uncharacterized protein n=1 Tax=Lacibacterium aquatile TaxID=1168082 RepID=A0ABW5DV53_9PROT
MMNVLIDRLRALATSFDQRVAGAADEAGVLSQQLAVLPAAFVHPVEDKAEAPIGDYHLCQHLAQRWAVVAVLDATADPLGYAAAADGFGIIRSEVWRALLGWQPSGDCGPVHYIGAKVLKRDAARLWVGFTVEVPKLLTDDAGYGPPANPDDPVFDAGLVPFERMAPAYRIGTTTVPMAEDLILPPQ